MLFLVTSTSLLSLIFEICYQRPEMYRAEIHRLKKKTLSNTDRFSREFHHAMQKEAYNTFPNGLLL